MDSNIDPEVTGLSHSIHEVNHNIDSDATDVALNLLQQFNQQDEPHDASNEINEENQEMSNGATPKLYPYNPNEKPPRLGRPRRNINHSLSPPETSSSQNHNEAKISKFRLDSRPVEGSGSRGGKGGRKPPRGRVTSDSLKKQKQSTLNFETATDEQNEGEQVDTEEPAKRQKLILKLPPQKVSAPQAQTQPKPRRKPTKNSNGKSISKTTVVYTRSKQSRQLPGPLIGLCYNLYDDNLVDPYHDSRKEKIALGFPVRKNPYAKDIVYILSFLMKFKDIIPLENNLGPHNFEVGLSLPIYEDPSPDASKYTPRKDKLVHGPDYDVNYVSDQMDGLFKKLLSLVLNRKKLVTSHQKAIQELKPQCEALGLPVEWKTLINVRDLKFSNLEPVDLNNPRILMDDVVKRNHQWNSKNCPIYDSNFEFYGLKGLKDPVDRLIMLRTLVNWCLIQSDLIKTYIHNMNQAIDIPGERDTNYGSRAMLYGFKDAEDTKREVEKKLARRKSEDDVKYIDPTSDPSVHPFSLRFNEQVIGDLGFNIGRFYLCRMSDESNGGHTDIKKMERAWRALPVVYKSIPSNFKLFVQDTHQMLFDSLSCEGVEFNSNGKEVRQSYKTCNDAHNWYEVASNAQELNSFMIYLKKRVILSHQFSTEIPHASLIHQPVFNLYDVLFMMTPHIQLLEEYIEHKKSTRRKPIDYSDRRAAERLGLEEDEVMQENFDDEEDENYVDPDLVPEEIEDEEYAEEEEEDAED